MVNDQAISNNEVWPNMAQHDLNTCSLLKPQLAPAGHLLTKE